MTDHDKVAAAFGVVQGGKEVAEGETLTKDLFGIYWFEEPLLRHQKRLAEAVHKAIERYLKMVQGYLPPPDSHFFLTQRVRSSFSSFVDVSDCCHTLHLDGDHS